MKKSITVITLAIAGVFSAAAQNLPREASIAETYKKMRTDILSQCETPNDARGCFYNFARKRDEETLRQIEATLSDKARESLKCRMKGSPDLTADFLMDIAPMDDQAITRRFEKFSADTRALRKSCTPQ